ncbi:hypothetical protein [Myxococcus sp. SDU36]|uniref:hypothetical protein n=1 Tax=Myxococcus sp. SDU36 TaxID=2831967 RepID=UPI002543C122|nr:hypothetical protein [Myxococcus sp. SDU36]WIG94646.1 hypothetical protein KGD87_29655 [Myxococcus sp. SDU36]
MTTARRPSPGSAMRHPITLAAVALLILNDHVLKAQWPSWWTGKLSDVAGLAMFPLLLQGLWEHLGTRNREDFEPSRAVLHGCVLVTGLCFSAIQVSELAGDGWRHGLGLLQWPPRATWALLTDAPRLPRVLPVAHVADAEDLLTLPALLVALKVGGSRCAPRTASRMGAPDSTPA